MTSFSGSLLDAKIKAKRAEETSAVESEREISKDTRKKRAKKLFSTEEDIEKSPQDSDSDIYSGPEMTDSPPSEILSQSTPRKRRNDISPWEEPTKKAHLTPAKSTRILCKQVRSSPRNQARYNMAQETLNNESEKSRPKDVSTAQTTSPATDSSNLEVLRYLRNINYEVRELRTSVEELRSTISLSLKSSQILQADEDVMCQLNLPLSSQESLEKLEEMLRNDEGLKNKLVSSVLLCLNLIICKIFGPNMCQSANGLYKLCDEPERPLLNKFI